MKPTAVLGIDISKSKFDVCLITTRGGKEKYRKFSNDINGFEKLADFLQDNGVEGIHACLEPTGRFGNKLALWLYERGNIVSVVNPYRIKGFAISELQRSKTDKLDSGIIARFCQMHEPKEWAPQSKAVEELQQIGRYIDELKGTITEEKNRLKAGLQSEPVCSAIERHIEYLNAQVSKLQKKMREIVKSDERLTQAFEVLTTICGVGEVTAFAFLGELGLGEQFQSARQVEAYCGLNPRLRQSGESINHRPRLSKMGNLRMRRALYMPAVAALKHNPAIIAYGNRLRVAGKHSMVIIGAVMRKLLRIMFAVVRSNRPYNIAAHMERTLK
jgi:transposase